MHILRYINPHSTGQTNQLHSPEDIAAEIGCAASNHQGNGQSTEHPPPGVTRWGPVITWGELGRRK